MLGGAKVTTKDHILAFRGHTGQPGSESWHQPGGEVGNYTGRSQPSGTIHGDVLHSKHRSLWCSGYSVRTGERVVGWGWGVGGYLVQICFLAAVRPQDAAKGLKLGFLTCNHPTRCHEHQKK